MCITLTEGHFRYKLYVESLQHQPYPDFHAFLKGSLFPGAAHAPLPVHNFLPQWDISAVVIHQDIHSSYTSEPSFQIFLFLLGLLAGLGGLRCYGIILRVMLVDQIQQILDWWIVPRRYTFQIFFQYFFYFFYDATVLSNRVQLHSAPRLGWILASGFAHSNLYFIISYN